MFREEFYFHKNFTDKEQLLKKMTQQLFQQGFVPEGFHDSIMKREAINQTNINEWLAIPHPMSLLAKRSAVEVAVLPKGVNWGQGDLVKFVFLFAISKEDYEDTEEIYSLLLELMEREDIQQAILQQNDFQNFLKQIKQL